MNHEPILEALAAKPGMRSVDLADKLDRDTVEVEGALLALIKIGHVEVGEGVGANGKPTVVYTLTDAYLASDAAATLRATALVANFRVDGWEAMSRADKAEAFMDSRPNKTASGAELHIVMGLPPEIYVSAALSHCITSGRFVRDGKNWKLGVKVEEPALVLPDTSAAASAVDLPSGTVIIPRFLTDEPDVVAEAVAARRADDLAARLSKAASDAARADAAAQKVEAKAQAVVPAKPGTAEVPGAMINPATLSTGQLADLYSAVTGEMGLRDLATDGAGQRQARAAVFASQLADGPETAPIEYEPPAPSVTRFAIWSDGTFEVQRDGVTALVLADDELGDMLGFIADARGAA